MARRVHPNAGVNSACKPGLTYFNPLLQAASAPSVSPPQEGRRQLTRLYSGGCSRSCINHKTAVPALTKTAWSHGRPRTCNTLLR